MKVRFSIRVEAGESRLNTPAVTPTKRPSQPIQRGTTRVFSAAQP